MTRTLLPVENSAATARSEQVFGEKSVGEVVMRLAQRLWPTKTAYELSARTGLSLRACEYWLAERSGLSSRALANLIASDAGLDVIAELLAARGAVPAWWDSFRTLQEISELRRRQDEVRRRLEALERGAS